MSGDEPSRQRRPRLLSLVLVFTVALPVVFAGLAHLKRQRTERELSRTSAEIAALEVQVERLQRKVEARQKAADRAGQEP